MFSQALFLQLILATVMALPLQAVDQIVLSQRAIFARDIEVAAAEPQLAIGSANGNGDIEIVLNAVDVKQALECQQCGGCPDQCGCSAPPCPCSWCDKLKCICPCSLCGKAGCSCPPCNECGRSACVCPKLPCPCGWCGKLSCLGSCKLPCQKCGEPECGC